MLPIHLLLERFKNLTNTEKAKKQYIAEVFKERGFIIEVNQIQISPKTIFIKVQPIIKTEIMLKKSEFLERIKQIPGLSTIETIQ